VCSSVSFAQTCCSGFVPNRYYTFSGPAKNQIHSIY
jgi:hypothetical protein